MSKVNTGRVKCQLKSIHVWYADFLVISSSIKTSKTTFQEKLIQGSHSPEKSGKVRKSQGIFLVRESQGKVREFCWQSGKTGHDYPCCASVV